MEIQRLKQDGWPDMEEEMGFPALAVTAAIDGQQDADNSILCLSTPQLGNFERISKKALYLVAVKVHHQATLRKVKPSGWPGDLGPGSYLRGCWRSLYKPPIEKAYCGSAVEACPWGHRYEQTHCTS
uniref:Uncharacterized protein n=1 Tax=Anguilla anguilla TaxID=7936 RepID=A0A0E9RCD5_ANGAN